MYMSCTDHFNALYFIHFALVGRNATRSDVKNKTNYRITNVFVQVWQINHLVESNVEINDTGSSKRA